MRPYQKAAAKRFIVIMLIAASIHGMTDTTVEKPPKEIDHTMDTEFRWLEPVDESGFLNHFGKETLNWKWNSKLEWLKQFLSS